MNFDVPISLICAPNSSGFGHPATLDLDEVGVIDIDGIRFLNECLALGVQLVNCSPYIREWMLQEKRAREGEK